MGKHLIVSLIVATTVFALQSTPASADGREDDPTPSSNSSPTGGSTTTTGTTVEGRGYIIRGNQANDGAGDSTANAAAAPVGDYHEVPVCTTNCSPDSTCVTDGERRVKIRSWYVLPDGSISGEREYCPADPIGSVTPGLVATAFRRIALPAPRLVIQPPDGLTLVNFDTNFYTTTEPIARTVTLLGRRVTLEATPSTYRWTFGDGETLKRPRFDAGSF